MQSIIVRSSRTLLDANVSVDLTIGVCLVTKQQLKKFKTLLEEKRER